MARYVDIENPINVRGITFIDENHDVLISLSDLRKALQMLPAADAVPRAEVEELIRENESLAKTVNEASELIRKLRSKDENAKTKVAPTVSKMEQVRSEVVLEIFEEIGKSVTSKIPPYIRPIFKDDRNFEDGFRDGKTDALIEVLMIIAALKKKYTEKEGRNNAD